MYMDLYLLEVIHKRQPQEREELESQQEADIGVKQEWTSMFSSKFKYLILTDKDF